MLGALVLTALATLVAAALALLAPLESQLRGDSIRIGEGTVTVDRGRLSNLPLTPAGEPVLRALDARLEQFFRINSATYVVWDERLTRIDDTDRDDRRAIDRIAPNVVRRALYGSSKTPHTLRSDVLVVTIRYRDRGRRFVLEMIKRVDAVTVAGSVVRNALIWAALIGFGVASAFGVALSSRLVRRLRLLRDTSRALLENEPSAGGMPRDNVPDEIGEVASGLRTLHERLQLPRAGTARLHRDRVTRAAHTAGLDGRGARAARRRPGGGGDRHPRRTPARSSGLGSRRGDSARWRQTCSTSAASTRASSCAASPSSSARSRAPSPPSSSSAQRIAKW